MMRIDLRPRHKNSARPPEKDAPKFLQWLRGRPCIFALEGGCEGKIEAAHLDFAGGKGVGTKVSDRFTVPMCAHHHGKQHWTGWDSFCRLMKVTKPALLNAADRFWKAWPGRVAWERKLNA